MAHLGPQHKNTGPLRGRGRFGGTPRYPLIDDICQFLLDSAVSLYLGGYGWEELPETACDITEILLGLLFLEPEVQPVLDVVPIPSGDAVQKPNPGGLVRIMEVQAKGVEDIIKEENLLASGHPGVNIRLVGRTARIRLQ